MAWGLPFHFVVTATNRPPRAEERPGVHYHFLADAEFDRLLQEGGFIEHAQVYGQKKGVPRGEIEAPRRQGQDVLARVDIQGARTLREIYGEATLLIWIAPPSLDEAVRRMLGREGDDAEQVRLRREAAEQEAAGARDFDHVVVNETGRLEDTARRVVEIVAAEKAARSRRR
jgi:guanylate kinase